MLKYSQVNIKQKLSTLLINITVAYFKVTLICLIIIINMTL